MTDTSVSHAESSGGLNNFSAMHMPYRIVRTCEYVVGPEVSPFMRWSS